MNFNRCMMIQQVGWNIQSTIAKAYPKFPESGILKLKTDGSYCPASGKSGMVGVLRDDRGNLILVFSSASSCCSST
ncbi:hypothetical protein R3W88_027853 [Solanum pinnatisectum]|uniref:RNase H type-1 domain-containing protein n=1 Tax=Solanum pinnatisectum TaxID=50273 RepID=A0AAV9LK25_9SOLN|nr:hypothetical protein R3W88_027853 [Solanum pinnatisectum]